MADKLIVTNKPISNSNYDVMTFDGFIDAASTEEGVDYSAYYFDVGSIPTDDPDASSDDYYYSIAGTGLDNLYWFLFDEDYVPDWFDQVGGTLSDPPEGVNGDGEDEEYNTAIQNAMAIADYDYQDDDDSGEDEEHYGRIITFGSAKGGSGKTFTTIITAIYYAKEHPDERVCLLDLDIEEPQVGIVTQEYRKNIHRFYIDYKNGNGDFEHLYKYRMNNPKKFPKNLDFYIPPRALHPVQEENYWQCVMFNLMANYDTVFFDTGTTYMETPAIASAYKLADKIILVAMANLSSVVTVSWQYDRLIGARENDVYSAEEDQLEDKINLVITNYYQDGGICANILKKLSALCPVIAKFGNITPKINEAQVLGRWDVFDKDMDFRQKVRDIYE